MYYKIKNSTFVYQKNTEKVFLLAYSRIPYTSIVLRFRGYISINPAIPEMKNRPMLKVYESTRSDINGSKCI